MGPTPLDIQQTIQLDAVRGFHLHIIIKATDAIGKCKPKNFKGKEDNNWLQQDLNLQPLSS